LLELLLAIVIAGVIAAFAIVLSGSVRNAAKVRETDGRMAEIAAKAKATYRNTENLPVAVANLVEEPAGTQRGLPVGLSEFNLEAKYRFDAWGNPFRYYRSPASGTLTIAGLTVNSKAVVGAIVSSGPNGRAESTISGTTIDTAGDDIVLAIDVSQEAIEIALEELKVLQSKVSALDAVYQGIDNDGADGVDEEGCVFATYAAAPGCPPTASLTNDPNCGTATLDHIETDPYSCTATTPLGAIREIYSLSSAYQTDPWGNDYHWGCLTGAGCTDEYATTDPRYHKFFSVGPNGTAGDADDIIP